MEVEQEYLNMISDTARIAAQEKASRLGELVSAYKSSENLVNNVEFWRWMGDNYPKDLSSTTLIQEAAMHKERWLNTQIQGKRYEWDYMLSQRNNPLKILSAFDAGNCPTQPGIDITETSIIDGAVKATYQNKAYLSTNNPDLHNTPYDAIVVTNSEKVGYAREQGYQVDEYMNANEIKSIRDLRFKQAYDGNASTTYNIKNIAEASIKAGAVAAVIGATVESVVSYREWKRGKLTDEQYVAEIVRAGGDSGVTCTASSAIMVPVNVAITSAGVSSMFAIPVAFLVGASVNSVVAPCFGRGRYKEILGRAKYYQAIEDMYDDFVTTVEKASSEYMDYIYKMKAQETKYNLIKKQSIEINNSLKDLYDSI